MDYKKPAEVVDAMIHSGSEKIKLPLWDLMIRGILSGAFLGFGTTLAITATVQTGLGIVGAIIFPTGFIIIVLMGLELVTGSFAILPTAYLDGKVGFSAMVKNMSIVFTANLLGGLLYAVLFWISVTNMGHNNTSPLVAAIIKIAEAKTIGYAQYGTAGIVTSIAKAILCNWMVTMGVVLFMTSASTIGKIVAAWIPIFIFFAQGFEHAVVNMFVIPAGMLLGANVTVADWWIYNQLPVTFGNLVGGVVLTSLALYVTYRKKKGKVMTVASEGQVVMETMH